MRSLLLPQPASLADCLVTKGDVIKDKTDPKLPMIKLPSESNGLAMVFRTFDQVSYGLVMDGIRPVRINDLLKHPDASE